MLSIRSVTDRQTDGRTQSSVYLDITELGGTQPADVL